MRGVPAHAWNEEIFRLLGNCLVHTLAVDGSTLLKESMEMGRVQVILEKQGSLPSTLSLWVDDCRFNVEVEADELEVLVPGASLEGSGSKDLQGLGSSGDRVVGVGSKVEDDGASTEDSNFESTSAWRRLSFESGQGTGFPRSPMVILGSQF